MSGEYPGNGAPDGWFRGGDGNGNHNGNGNGNGNGNPGDGPAPSQANPWRTSSADDVTTQMPKVPAQGRPGDGDAPTQLVQGHIPAPADMWGGFDGRTRQQEPFQAPQQPFQSGQLQSEQRPAFVPDQPPAGPFDLYPGGAGSGAAPQRRHTKRWVFAGIGTAAVIGVAAVLVFDQAATPGAASSHHAAAPKPTPSGFQPTATTPAGDAEQTAAAFFTAWQGGNDTQAAALTDDPTDAQSALAAYRTGLNLSGLSLTEQNATAAGLVTFSVRAQVSSSAVVSAGATTAPSPSTAASPAATGSASASSASGTWTYSSHLTAYKKDGGWYIKWDPSLVAPNATASAHPVALAIKPGAKSVTDADGNSLAASSQSALQSVAALVKKNTDTGKGTAGLEIVLENTKGEIVSGSTSQLSAPVAKGVVKTTIDPELESLAATAVGKLPRSSMVVIRPSTGAILAVANTPGSGDTALTGTLAPGSDFKVVSTASLLLHGMLPQGIETHVGCPLVVTVQGVKIHNSTDDPSSGNNTTNEDFEPPTTPFSTDFAQSCNNAFTQWWQQMAGGKLANTALNYFGLNQSWDIGLGTPGSYFHMPSDQSGSELAEEMYGQGVIQANPLSMASVAATVDTGEFHQPYLVPGLTDLKTATPLPTSVKTQLYTVMREVITSGTAVSVGFGSGVYGKTGTAEADANKDKMPNGWMIVFDPSKDIAIAAVVVDSNFGAATAGPEVNYVLQHY